MKVLSLWQPWASLIACGVKHLETRHWPTQYRGPLAIHAAKSREGMADVSRIRSALYDNMFMTEDFLSFDTLPFGAIVCVGQLSKCSSSESIVAAYEADDCPAGAKGQWLIERELGNYEPGRFGWLLTNVQELAEPIECVGRQGLFDIPDSVFPAHIVEAVRG